MFLGRTRWCGGGYGRKWKWAAIQWAVGHVVFELLKPCTHFRVAQAIAFTVSKKKLLHSPFSNHYEEKTTALSLLMQQK